MTPVAAAAALSNEGMGAGERREKEKQRVAIIGTGLAGLTSSYLLTLDGRVREEFDVHLFERNSSFGLDASSMNAENGKRIDVPMRSVNGGYYPNLVNLYKQLQGVHLRATNFTYSFSSSSSSSSSSSYKKPGNDRPFLLYNGMNGIRGVSMPSPTIPKRYASLLVQASLFFQQSHLLLVFITSYLSLLFLSLYHHLSGHLLRPEHVLCSTPMHVYLRRHRRWIHPTFVEMVLYATFSAVTTSTYADVKNLPMAEVMLYIATTFGRSHYAVQGGVERVESALTKHVNLDNVQFGRSVEAIDVDALTGKAALVVQSLHGTRQRIEGFHHVILACPASLSVRLLQSYVDSLYQLTPSRLSGGKDKPFDEQIAQTIDTTRKMQQCLVKIPYVHNIVINHTDFSLLPVNSSHRRDLNIAVVDCPVSEKCTSTPTKTTIATHMIQLDQNSPVILQTTYSALASSSSTGASTHVPAKSKVVSEATFTRATTPSSAKQTLSGLFEWRQEQSAESFIVRLLHCLVDIRSLELKSDWITSIRYVLTGRRSIMTLGPLQRSQRSSSSSSPSSLKKESVSRVPCVWTCGSYAQGIPLLEGCVTSSTLIVEEIRRRHP